MWGNLLSAIGKGVVGGATAAGKGIKRGATALVDQFDEGDDGEDMMRTPGFVPSQSQGPRTMTPPTSPAGPFGAVPMGEPAARSLPLIDQDPMGAPGPTPNVAQSRREAYPDPLTGQPPKPQIPYPDLRRPVPMATPANPPAITPPEGMRPKEVGSPQDYRGQTIEDPLAFQRDQWMRPRGETDESGKFKVRRSLKDALINAGLGFLGGAAGGGGLGGGVGGAIAGGAGTAIDPLRGQEFRFDTTERPRIEEEQGRQRTSRRQRIEDAIQQSTVDAIPRKARMEESQIKQNEAQTQAAIENAKSQQVLRDSQVKLNQAREQAIKSGQGKSIDLADENGEVHTYQVLADGTVIDRGLSAKAAINKANISSREKTATERNVSNERRTGMQQSGATGRTAMTQEGANTRQEKRLDAQSQGGQAGGSKLRKPTSGSGKEAQGVDVDKYAKQKGVDPAKWRAHLKKQGWAIKD